MTRYTLYIKREDGGRIPICTLNVHDKFDAPREAKARLYRILRATYGNVSVGNWMKAKVGREIKARYIMPGRGVVIQRYILVESRTSGILHRPALRRNKRAY